MSYKPPLPEDWFPKPSGREYTPSQLTDLSQINAVEYLQSGGSFEVMANGRFHVLVRPMDNSANPIIVAKYVILSTKWPGFSSAILGWEATTMEEFQAKSTQGLSPIMLSELVKKHRLKTMRAFPYGQSLSVERRIRRAFGFSQE